MLGGRTPWGLGSGRMRPVVPVGGRVGFPPLVISLGASVSCCDHVSALVLVWLVLWVATVVAMALVLLAVLWRRGRCCYGCGFPLCRCRYCC